MDYFSVYKKDISSYLEEYLVGKIGQYRWMGLRPEALERLASSVGNGKMVRGGLVCLGAAMVGGRVDEMVVRVAAAMELIHWGLLVHDDVIDRDDVRRGQLSMAAAYTAYGRTHGAAEAEHFGRSQAICSGDIGFFLAFELLAAAALGPAQKILADEFTRVGLAEMEEVDLAMLNSEPTEAQILAVYRDKTARYTFSLPLMVGSLLAGADVGLVGKLAELGEYMGIVYQLRDDELGLYGDPVKLGKPVGSDIAEGKKTLFYRYLFDQVTAAEAERLRGIFGWAEANEADRLEVLSMLERYGVREKVATKMQECEQRAREVIATLVIDEQYRRVLDGLVEYSATREA